ncbi:MAG TPA: hypothetical protein VH253_19055, partial [Phycisphaerae bacterium]|nr:hypothetical protein [Phycisphaerae bacterium]
KPRLAPILLATARREGLPALPYVIALLLLAGAGIAFGLYMPRDIMFVNSQPGLNALLSPWSHLATTLFFALAGIAFGTRQAYEDRSLDAWTILIHRPASRVSLFLGRTLAGLTLYTFTAAIVLAALGLAGRSHFAGEFFHWRFLLPACADAFAGLAYYFAAMAAAERHARWWVSRVIPLGPALLATLLVVNAQTFPTALIAATPLLLLSALTAYATFASHGFTLPRAISRPARAALALSLLLGFTILSLFALNWARRYSDETAVIMDTHLTLPLRSDNTVVLPDGSFGRRIITRNNAGRLLSDDIQDAQGNSHPFTASSEWRAQTFQPYIPPYRSSQIADSSEGRKITDFLYEQWYWVAGADRFYGRRGVNGPSIGTLGRNGFVPPGHSAAPFDGEVFDHYEDHHVSGATRGIYAVSLHDHTTQKLATSTPDVPIEAAGTWYSARRDVDFAVAIATPHALTAYANDGRTLQTFPLAHDPLASKLQVYYTYPQNQYAFLYHLGDTLQLDLFDASAKLLSSHTAPAHTVIPGPPPIMPPAAITYLHRADILDGLLDTAENPLALAAARRLIPDAVNPYPLPPSLAPPRSDTTPDHLRIPSWRLATTLAALILLTLLTFPLARARAPKIWPLWLLATLLFGLPAALTLLALHPRRPRTAP